jgi:hypothetical protein
MKRENKDAIELTRKELLARKPMTHDLTCLYCMKKRLYMYRHVIRNRIRHYKWRLYMYITLSINGVAKRIGHYKRRVYGKL